MDKLAKFHKVWQLLVTYVNSGEEFKPLFFTCMNYCGTVGIDSLEGDLDVLYLGRKLVTVHMHETNDSVSFCRDVRRGLKLEKAAKKYHEDFKRALTWLTDRRSKSGEAAIAFLWKEARNIKVSARVDDDLYSQWIDEYGTVASPICKFILERMDFYNERRKYMVRDQDATPNPSYNENLRRLTLPVGRCKYCGDFMVLERSGKQFCKDLCRAQAAHKKKTKAERAKQIRDWRRVTRERKVRRGTHL
jgi:hypothetical protein